MHRPLTVAAGLLVCGFALPGSPAVAQSAKDLAGIYSLMFETRDTNGTKNTVYTKGALALDSSGHYSLMTIAPDLPKVASNNRMTATPEEAKAIVAGSVSHYGTFSVSGDTLIFKIESATFANWNGIEQKRPFTLRGDELTYSVAAASGGGSVTLTWKRTK
jgi:hypothetical protein